MPGEARKVRPGLVGMALRAVPKMKLNMGRLGNASLPPLRSWDSQGFGFWNLEFRRLATLSPFILVSFRRIFLARFQEP